MFCIFVIPLHILPNIVTIFLFFSPVTSIYLWANFYFYGYEFKLEQYANMHIIIIIDAYYSNGPGYEANYSFVNYDYTYFYLKWAYFSSKEGVYLKSPNHVMVK